jgi:diamine N-acetyltransferase
MIYGERIRLRAPERDDIPLFVKWLNDPEVRRGLILYLPMSKADEEAWFENMIKGPADEHPLVIEIRTDDDWKPIGNSGIHKIDWRNRSAEVGLFIGEIRLWNQGYGTEVMSLLLKHGFETLNLNRIGLQVYETNHGAIRAYEKAGFVHEGRFRQGVYIDGRYEDTLFMSALREEWFKR